LLDPLARLISKAAETSQVIVVSHAGKLVDALNQQASIASYELKKELGETVVDGIEKPAWNWPSR
ncbi:MAG: ATP-binding protein, partial [Pseudomonadota bacterium]